MQPRESNRNNQAGCCPGSHPGPKPSDNKGPVTHHQRRVICSLEIFRHFFARHAVTTEITYSELPRSSQVYDETTADTPYLWSTRSSKTTSGFSADGKTMSALGSALQQ